MKINVPFIKEKINIKELDDYSILNDVQKYKISGQEKIIESIQIFINELENKKINSIEQLDKQTNKIKYILRLFKKLKKLIETNHLFKAIKEKNINFTLFGQILLIFDDKKIEGINSDINALFDEFLKLTIEKRNELISNLDNCRHLSNLINLNSDLEKTKEYHIAYNEIKNQEIIKINNKIIILSIKDKIKEIYNKYALFKEKLINNKDIKEKRANNDINSVELILSFLTSCGIKEDMIYNTDIDKIIQDLNNKKFIKIINNLCSKLEALNFIFSISSQDCRNIQELAGEVHGGNNQNFLSIEELLTIEKIVESFEYIQSEIKNEKNKNKNEDEIIIVNTMEQIEEEDLEKYLNKYQQYKEFFTENLDKKKFTAEVIQKILNKSEFLILNCNENNFRAYYKNEEKDNKIIFKEFNYDHMIYLRDRALTRNKINDSLLDEKDEFMKNLKEEEQIIFLNNKLFVEIVHQINDLLKLLNKIIQKGFLFYFEPEQKENNKDIISLFQKIENINNFSLLKIKIKIEKGNESYKVQFLLNGEEYKNFYDVYGTINKIYDNIESIQRNGYMKKKYINFIYGKQFQLFFDYFLNEKNNDNFNYYLNYFTNKEKFILNNFDYKNQELNIKNDFILNFYQNFIEQCEIFLDKILTDNGLSLAAIFGQNKIKENFIEFNGIYLNGSENLENEIIYFYKYFTNNIPLASTLLLCKKDTSSEEIISFLNRAILCKYHIFFCLARTEYLSEEKKNIILDTITDLLGRGKNENKEFMMNSCLVIINNNLEDELCKSLFRLKYIKTFDIPQEEKNKIKLFEEDNDKILIVHSDHSGVGKSTYIKNKAKEEDYIYFPIGGIFSKENTLKRLQNLNKEKNIIDEKKHLLIHVDLYDTEQKTLMNDFLYFILFTKLYGQDNNIFYLSKKIKIYIEIPNSFINYFAKYPILKLFPDKKLSLEKLEPLIVPDDICSNIRIVSLYLKLLKEENTVPEKTSQNFKADNKIDKNEIVFPFTPPELILKDESYDYNKIVIKAEDENKKLGQKECQRLIMDEIKKEIKNPTYYQITTFINVLASQLIQFNRNYFLSACTILDSGRFNNCSVRSLIVRKFIELTRYFTKGAFTELLNEQEKVLTLINSKGNEKIKKEKANLLLEEFQHESISFKNMDLALVFFHGGDNSNYFSIITNKNYDDKTYIDLLSLQNFQSGKDIIKRIHFKDDKDKKKIKLEGSEKLKDYTKFKQTEFLEELKSILDLKNPIEKQKEENSMISLSEITKNYVFTEDNFIKMCLILIRLRSNIPVIMMGETGCGKTSLIRKLSELMNNGDCNLVIDNIHAGHTNEDIINFIETKVITKAKELAEQEKIKKEKYLADQIYEEKKLWVFFDELNTCKSMDLLSEIICKHSYQGKKLPENIVFIGAVNPYRKSKKKRVGLKINNNDEYEESDLVYTVNPMPHSLLNYVFDFGSLNSEDEKRYIKNMVIEVISEEELSDFTTELIAISQNFIREKNGVSAVSLREIRRFIVFYEFFIEYLKIRKQTIIEEKIEEMGDVKYIDLNEKEIKLYAINLSIYLGYYLRLTDINDKTDNKNEGGLRKILYEKLNEKFKEKSKIDFLMIPEKEENFIADNVELEKGIAKNRALLENLFSLFVAINTKIPIFILGKPGCSKSLSVQLINNAMKGSSSNNPFFKKYPKMYVSTYQGSLNSTSKGVKEVFDKAREILKVKENKEKISTFYFDEMGLAEHSPHNPLKVIHSELEYDLNEEGKKISFLGVSNWSLDSAKMNRGLSIDIPDPNEKDIQTTSITIAKSYLGENLPDNIKLFFEHLGSAFYKYKQEFKKNNTIKKYEDFHGNRDFYHLIKYPAPKIKEALKNDKIDDQLLSKLSVKSLERNFGGLILDDNKYKNGISLITEKLSEYNKEVKDILNKDIYNVKNKIKDNLTELSDDYLSRYLLLITRTNIGIYLLSSFLKSINGNDNNFNNYIILIGSMFIDDIQKEEYATKILSKIKMNMEKDIILVLKDFESIYPSLYDLFNQNFVKVKGKNYARIALGNKTNSFSEVNKKFRCVIIVDQDKIYEQEIPFLNRFEKQNISFEYLMNDLQIWIANKLYEKCVKIINYDNNKIKIIDYDINNLLINCDEEEILGFVFMETQEKKEIKEEDYNNIEDDFIFKLAITLPQDIILILLLQKENWNDNEENKRFYNNLINCYNNNIHNNIKSYLSNYDGEGENNKIIIYTFTKMIESIKSDYLYSYDIKSLGKLSQNNIKQKRISSIINEFELETEIEDFLDNKDLKIFILKLSPSDCSSIDYLKVIIENKETEYKNKNMGTSNKLFIFLIHLERINKKDLENQYKENLDLVKKKMLTNTLSHLAGYKQIFIDDINGQDYYGNDHKIITLDKMIKMSNNDIYNTFINLDTIFLENLNSSLCFFEYSFNDDEKFINKDIYISRLIELFKKDKHLTKLIDEKIMENINNKYSDDKNKNIFEKIVKEEKFSRGDICIYDLVKKVLNKNYLNAFKILYVELENNYYFSSLLFKDNNKLNNIIENDENLYQKIKEIFINDVKINNKIPENEIKIDIIIGYNLPSKNLIEEIINFINNNILTQYRENDEEFKNKYFEQEEELEEEKKQYEYNVEVLNKNTQNNLLKIELIKEIELKLAKGEKNKFYDLLLDDYLLTYINKNFIGPNSVSLQSIKSFMRIILNNKFTLEENNLDLKIVSSIFNFIESYSMEIVSLIKLYIFLKTFENSNDLNAKINSKISELNKEYDDFNISKNIKIVNRVFYNIMGSLINILISDLYQILSEITNQDSLNDLLDNFNNIYYSLLSNNNNLNLSSKEVHLFHETIKIMSILSFNDNNDDMEQNKKLMIDFIQKKIIKTSKEKDDKNKTNEGPKLKKDNNNEENAENEDTEEEKSLKNYLNNFYNYYKEKNDINFASLFSSILFDEFIKEYNEKYRQYILKTILDDENLIPNNLLLIKIILSEYIKPTKENLDDALDYISGEETFFPLLNECNKDIVNQNIMKIFEITINLYFDSLKKIEDNIINDLFDIFKEYLRVITDTEYEKYYNEYCNENLVKIYVLSFIKIYLNRFVVLLCEKRSSLQGKETEIINEINKEPPIANTIKFYLIILLHNNPNFSNNLKEIIQPYISDIQKDTDKNKFDEILKNGIIPNDNKFPFNEFFAYIIYPSFDDFKYKFYSSIDNIKKYPLLNEYIKNEIGPKNLKHLCDYNKFINLMIGYYSGNISRNEAKKEERHLNLEEIYKTDKNNFKDKFDKFKTIWNNYLSKDKDIKKIKEQNSNKFLDEIKGNERLAYFLIDNNEKEYGFFIAKGLYKFIEWQNSFLKPIIESYKEKNNLLSCYVSQMEKSVNVQNANSLQILQIENCFDKTYFNNFEELLSLYCSRKDDNINDFNYDFEKIEEELGKCLLPNKCLFNEKNIKYVCYQNEGFRNINYDFLIKFGKKYGQKGLIEENRKKIIIYADKEYNNFYDLYDSFILLINYLNNNISAKNDTKIIDFINKAKEKYINFNNTFINYFNEEGKDISIDKLLNSFLYMEHICFEHLCEKLNNKYKDSLDKSKQEEIINYFKEKHKDVIITQKEISTAVRRFITRYLLNDNIEEGNDPNLSLYICLERKYLWNNEIFSSIDDNFNDLIKQYLGSFSFTLEARHSLAFYNLISEEEKNYLKEERDKFTGKDKKTEENLKVKEQNNQKNKILGMGGPKQIKKGGKMKNKK